MVKYHIIVNYLIFVVRNCSEDATSVQSKSGFFGGLAFSRHFDILFNHNKTSGKTKHFIFGGDSNQPKS